MKRILQLALMLVLPLFGAQTIIFEDGFNDFSNWTLIDRDGNGINWNLDTFDLGAGMPPPTATASGGSSEDNLLRSKNIDIPGGGAASLSFSVKRRIFFGVSGNPHYAVYILPAGLAFNGTETPVFQETLNDANVNNRTVDLSGYAGQGVNIYFRYFNNTSTSLMSLDNIKVTSMASLGTAESEKPKKDISIYPNPVFDFMTIKTQQKIIKVEIYDMAGRKMNVAMDNDKLNMTGLKKGVYNINIETKESKVSRKIIKK